MNQHHASLPGAQLHRYWPLHIALHTPADEDRRVQGDIEHAQHREAIRVEQAMRLQDRYLPRMPGML